MFGKILSVIRVLALLFILSSYLMKVKLQKILSYLLRVESINSMMGGKNDH